MYQAFFARVKLSPSWIVNNAGTAFFCPITDEPDVEQLAKVFQLNVLGPFFMVNSVVPHMPPGGRIINISSTNSKRGNVSISTYAASKAALDNLTWTWAEEVRLLPRFPSAILCHNYLALFLRWFFKPSRCAPELHLVLADR